MALPSPLSLFRRYWLRIPLVERRAIPKRLGIVWGITTTLTALEWVASNFKEEIDIHLAYSFCISTLIWFLSDVGRFAWKVRSPHHWPLGWRMPVHLIGSVAVGYVLGTSLGDSYAGLSTWSLILVDQRRLFTILASSALISLGFVSFFYQRGKMEAFQRQAADAKLRLLESQLDPHMLFNTLANLRALIAIDPALAQAMLDRLNDYLRATLTASRTGMHSLDREFDRLNDYLALMAIRMGSRMQHAVALPKELAEIQIPSLLLQPLVENAIRHGLEPSVGGGRLEVSARRDNHHLVLTVSDTGVGLPGPEGPPTGPTASHAGTGFGHSSVVERLQAAYGSEAALTVSARPGGGTLAQITLPL